MALKLLNAVCVLCTLHWQLVFIYKTKCCYYTNCIIRLIIITTWRHYNSSYTMQVLKVEKDGRLCGNLDLEIRTLDIKYLAKVLHVMNYYKTPYMHTEVINIHELFCETCVVFKLKSLVWTKYLL